MQSGPENPSLHTQISTIDLTYLVVFAHLFATFDPKSGRAQLQDELRNRLASMQSETGAYEEGMRERYSAMVADANEQSCRVIADREARDRDEWARREKELSDRARELELQHVAYEDQLRQQFADLLKRAEENHREEILQL